MDEVGAQAPPAPPPRFRHSLDSTGDARLGFPVSRRAPGPGSAGIGPSH
jgi:hypothetical protein